MTTGGGHPDDHGTLEPTSGRTVWMDLDALAASYERANGVRPDRMRIGRAVARELEPDSTHPPHLSWISPTPGVWFPMQPDQPQRFLDRLQARLACRRRDGHFWHPADAMIAWYCCNCGTERDGMPQDGT
jgi:hypothetical protein